MAGPVLLLYNVGGPAALKIHALCQKLQIRPVDVTAEAFALPLGALAGIPPRQSAPSEPGEPFDEPMLVMANLLSPQFDALLQGLRENGIPRIPLKAVLTPTNLQWNAWQLHDELSREHEAMRRAHAQTPPGK